ncbi:histone-lysine N-methyltransferase SETMAR [Trichonephila clavipes]|nr:histone-lysine N-methyltransferase SETMAR [Trichonephila clavipes]
MAMETLIATLGWECLHIPPYSPNLAPSDFYLFPALEKNLAGGLVKQAVSSFFHMQALSFSWGIFLKLIKRYDKYLNVLGTYVEK